MEEIHVVLIMKPEHQMDEGLVRSMVERAIREQDAALLGKLNRIVLGVRSGELYAAEASNSEA